MTFELLPRDAFAPEAATAAEFGLEPFTLTLRSAMAADSEFLVGRIALLAGAPVLQAHAMRASVVPADSQALTITF